MDLKEVYDVTGILFEQDPDFYDEARMASMKNGEVSEVSFMYENDMINEESYHDNLLDLGVVFMIVGMNMCHKGRHTIEDITEQVNERLKVITEEMDNHDMLVALRNSGQYKKYAEFTDKTGEPKNVDNKLLDEIESQLSIIHNASHVIKHLDSEPTDDQRATVEAALDLLVEFDEKIDKEDGPDVEGFINEVRDFLDDGTGDVEGFIYVFEAVYDKLFDNAVALYAKEYHSLDKADDRTFY